MKIWAWWKVQQFWMSVASTIEKCNPVNIEVVSIGTNPTFKVNKVTMEYAPTMSKRFQFFGSRFLVFNIHIQYSIGTFLTLKGLLLTGFKNADSWCWPVENCCQPVEKCMHWQLLVEKIQLSMCQLCQRYAFQSHTFHYTQKMNALFAIIRCTKKDISKAILMSCNKLIK